MKKLTTAEAFTGEVPFTTAICSDKNIQSKFNEFLIDKLNFDIDLESVSYKHQVNFGYSGRADIVVHQYGEPSFVIECQDSKGDLDMLHIMKTIAYAHEAGVEDIVLLAEEISVEAVRLVEHLRTKHNHSIFMVTYDIFQVENQCHVFFRSNSNPMRMIVDNPRNVYDERARERRAELQSEFYSKYKERLVLNTPTMNYCSRRWDREGITLYANLRPQSSTIDFSSRKFDPELIEKNFSEMFPGLQVKLQADKGGRKVQIKGFADENNLVETFEKICQVIGDKSLGAKIAA